MPNMQPLAVNFSEQDSTLQLMPRVALFSSHHLNWKNIHLQFHRQPAWEIPESVFVQHTIVIHNSECMAQAERMLDGRRQHEQVGCGNIAIIPASVPHQVCWDRGADFMLLSLEPSRIAQIAYESVDLDRAELIPHFTKIDPLIHQIGQSLKTELTSSGSGNRLFVDSIVTALAIHLLRNYAVKQPSLPKYTNGLPKYRLQLALDYINDYLDRDLSLEAIASKVGMSQYYFCRLFKQSIGLAPYQYVIQQRVEWAKRLLNQPELPICDIALQCGFASQGHLNLHFKRLVGVTPKSFRKK